MVKGGVKKLSIVTNIINAKEYVRFMVNVI